jgi:hypothetical protein
LFDVLNCTSLCTNIIHSGTQAFSQKDVQASWDALEQNMDALEQNMDALEQNMDAFGRPNSGGKGKLIIFNYFPKYINISETK